jgi:Putative DNA-binding domain
MQSLADLESGVRDSVISGDFASVAPWFVGGQAVERRLAIHHRHYQASLIMALMDRFPATIWLVGSDFVTEAARIFISKHPPASPCIAEYGENFPTFLAECRAAQRIPYLREFAELEWHVGNVAIAVDEPPIAIEELRAICAGELPDTALILQRGVRYLKALWPVDKLLDTYLAEARPEQFAFEPGNVNLEIHGSRGEFRINRLGAAEFIFRRSVSVGRSIGDAALAALETDGSFDPGDALRLLLTSALIAGIDQGRSRSGS